LKEVVMVQPTATNTEESTAPGSSAPPPAPRRSGGRWRKWRARAIVLILIAAAIYLGLKLSQNKAGAAAEIDLGTLTLTSQVIPVETPRTGQVVSVDVNATDKVTAGKQLGALEVTTTNSQGNPVVSTLRLLAPRDGIVVDQPVTVGSTLQPGEPFVELYDPTKSTFSGQIPLKDLPEIAPGMIATLQAEGLNGTVKAVVDRVVPRVGTGDTDVRPNRIRLVLVPRNPTEIAGLVPGLRFTGTVDTSTGERGRQRLVHLGG
jgi:multidrug resistance efflux pump